MKFFKLLKKKFALKTEHQKKIILVFDEIFLGESKSVNTKTLTYLGLEDFGDGFKDKSQDKANHALVLMLQSLADNVQQPIAVFASKGPVKGTYLYIYKKKKLNRRDICNNKVLFKFISGVDISKIIVNAIFLLEDAGIHG